MRRSCLAVLCLGLLAGGAAASHAAPGGHLEGYVPVVSHAPGKLGSFWVSDLWIYNQGASVIHLWFNRQGIDSSDVDSVVVQLEGPVTYLPDVVEELLGYDNAVGSLHYLADGPVVVTTRNWTTAEGGGSFGQTIPGVPLAGASYAGTGQAGPLRMVANQEQGFRTNLGVANVSPLTVTALVEIFTADGEPAPGDPAFEIQLEPFAFTQVLDVLGRLDPGTREGLIVRVGVAGAEGAVVAYLSTADNTTNDVSYQEGFRFGEF